jgi:Disulphide bond corrector protein DsbC
MHKIAFIFALLGLATHALAQNKVNPVKWSFSAVKVADKEYDLTFNAEIQSGWHIYSLFSQGEDGPIPTTLNLNFVDGFEFVGGPKINGPKTTELDKVFKKELVRHHGNVSFVQRIQNYGDLKTLSGFIKYMACDNSKCMPPATLEFVFELNP